MKKLLLFIASSAMCCIVTARPKKYDPLLKLWYNKPASIWEEALPLGNAKTGAMVFGGVVTERFQLNDNTLWSGFPNPGNNPNGPKVLPQVRQQMFQGNYDSAAKLWKKMQGPYSARYLPMADLWLKFQFADSVPTAYYRDLDLNDATAKVRYTIKGVNYSRETFISFPDRVMVIKLAADRSRSINFSASLTSKLQFITQTENNDQIFLKGRAPKFVANRDFEPKQIEYDENPNGEGMRFEVHVRILTKNGTVSPEGNNLVVRNADEVTVYLTEATSFNGFDKSPGLQGKDPAADARLVMARAILKSFSTLKAAHVADYKGLFDRVELNLGDDSIAAMLPTNQRLRNYGATQRDNQLQVLYYQFGRYLLIAGSRPGSRPTNLQGIWNDHVQAPWGSNYTTNINTEMNYWLAENTNLSECHQPLFDFMNELAVNGAVTAKVNYNIPQGWVTHHNSDLWAKTSPPGGYEWDPRAMPRWSAWPMAGAWFSTHLWEHYLFTGDKKFLRSKAYPLMKGAAQFVLHWLLKDSITGKLITNPSTSPENTIKINGKEFQLSIASTMDMSITRELFTALIKTIDILKIDADFRDQLIQAKEKLYPYHIGQYGQLQEWFKDWDDPNDKHRHLSHLFGLYPGSQITNDRTPQLAAAAKQSLIHRGDMSTGWSMAWKINWWARLQDGEHAYKILSAAFTYIDPREKRDTMGGGGTYPNLFDAHPPFQIDGNYGASAGITEMLLQSHAGFISLLPALPSAWANGSVRGIKARGNFTVSLNWMQGKLVQATIYSGSGGNCRLRTLQRVKIIEARFSEAKGENKNLLNTVYGNPPFEKHPESKLVAIDQTKGYIIDFETQQGKTYTVIPL